MEFRELRIPGAWEITPKQFPDARGTFLEWFKQESFREATGKELDLAQANWSVSSAAVLRGIHFTDVPPGQAKYITCPRGVIFDVVVDLRVGSPTFGQWDSVLLDDISKRAVFIDAGLGHAFFSLEDHSTALYLCTSGYNPKAEHGIHPLDKELGIDWPHVGHTGRQLEPILSEKDAAAPTLKEAKELGLLPKFGAR